MGCLRQQRHERGTAVLLVRGCLVRQRGARCKQDLRGVRCYGASGGSAGAHSALKRSVWPQRLVPCGGSSSVTVLPTRRVWMRSSPRCTRSAIRTVCMGSWPRRRRSPNREQPCRPPRRRLPDCSHRRQDVASGPRAGHARRQGGPAYQAALQACPREGGLVSPTRVQLLLEHRGLWGCWEARALRLPGVRRRPVLLGGLTPDDGTAAKSDPDATRAREPSLSRHTRTYTSPVCVTPLPPGQYTIRSLFSVLFMLFMLFIMQ